MPLLTELGPFDTGVLQICRSEWSFFGAATPLLSKTEMRPRAACSILPYPLPTWGEGRVRGGSGSAHSNWQNAALNSMALVMRGRIAHISCLANWPQFWME